MKKNNRGYLLTETLIVITIVATIITMVYAIIVNYYIKQENEVTKFNTSEGLYIAGQIQKYFEGYESDFLEEMDASVGYIDITNKYSNLSTNLDIKKIYFSKNDLNPIINNPSLKFSTAIKKNLNEQQNLDENSCDYRYFIVFKDNSYATVGIFCDE